MNELLSVIAFALPVSPLVAVIAGLLLAALIAGASFFLLRSSKKKTTGTASANAPGAWQPQGGQTWNPQAPGQADQWNPQAPGQAGWGAQQQGANQWGGAAAVPPTANAWNAQAGAQQQAGWGGGQQPGANAWNAPGAMQQGQAWDQQGAMQQAPGWDQQGAMQPAQGWDQQGGFAQQGANAWSQPAQGQGTNPWDATALPNAGGQEAWSQPAAQQQGWGGQPAQQPQTAYGGSNPAWNQQGFAAQPAQPVADQWSNPAAQQYPGMGAGTGTPAWQQQQGGYADGDKTIMRPTGQQGGIGMVRVEEGKEPGKIYEVRKEALSIGRSRESDIFLEDLAVSRLHASIVNLGNGSYALKDEGSANGTKVNGQLVSKYQTFPLQEGDRIQLGQTVLVFAKH